MKTFVRTSITALFVVCFAFCATKPPVATDGTMATVTTTSAPTTTAGPVTTADVAGIRSARRRSAPEDRAIAQQPVSRAGRESVAADTAPIRRVLFGTSYEDITPITEARARALRAIGFHIIRPTIFPVFANPAPNVYDWRKLDRDIDEMRGAGFLVVPSICWAPRWWSAGKPTYELYTDGCTRWRKDAQSVMDIEFDDSKDYCTNPPPIGPTNLPSHLSFHHPAYQFGAALAQRHGRSIYAYAVWNEPGGDIYWPPIRQPDGMRRLIREVVAPMTAGIRAADPRAKFVGPEADGADVLRQALELEEELDLHLYDAITFHPYPWHSDWRNIFTRIDQEFVPSIVRLRDRRPIWYSESGGVPNIVEWAREVLASNRDVAMISIGDFRQWFEVGSWEANRPVLNDKGREMQRLIMDTNGGKMVRAGL